ncbi:MAG: LamG domain-containing protein, partial [Pedobacter sp.]
GESTPIVELLDGRKAVRLIGKSTLISNVKTPESLLGNSSFSVTAWVYNDTIEDEEPILSWTERGGVDLTNASLGYGSNKSFGAAAHWGWPDIAYKKLPKAKEWHHIALTFDGTTERLYVDGILDQQELKMLFIANLKNIRLGTNGDNSAFYSGAISSLKMYDIALSDADIVSQSKQAAVTDIAVYLDASKLDYGTLFNWKNEGLLKGSVDFGTGSGNVIDIYGQIALEFKGSGQLTLNHKLTSLISSLDNKPVSIVAIVVAPEFKDSKWHQIVNVIDGQTRVTYIDGAIDRSSKFNNLLGSNIKWKALNSLMVYRKEVDATEVLNLYTEWKNKHTDRLDVASFSEKPIALSPGLIQMTAAKSSLPGKVLQYLFTSKDSQNLTKTSGWQTKETYSDFSTSIN